MNLAANIVNAIEASPVFVEVTAKFNEYVVECNKTGHIISREEREKLNEIRMLTVLAADKAVQKLYADYLWETVHNA